MRDVNTPKAKSLWSDTPEEQKCLPKSVARADDLLQGSANFLTGTNETEAFYYGNP